MSETAMDRAIHETVEYVRREGFHIKGEMVEPIGRELVDLDNLPVARAVEYVQAHPEMRLHHELIWHNPTAGELYRQSQLQYFRRGITQVKRDQSGAVVSVREFHRVVQKPLAPAELRSLPTPPGGASVRLVQRAEERRAAVQELISRTPTPPAPETPRVETRPWVEAPRDEETPSVLPETESHAPLPAEVRIGSESGAAVAAERLSEEDIVIQAEERLAAFAGQFGPHRDLLEQLEPRLAPVFMAIEALGLA